MDARRTGCCCVSNSESDFSLLQCTRLACHMPMQQRRSYERESNCVKYLEEQEFLVRKMKASRVGGWCIVRKGGRPGAWILLVLMRWSHADTAFSDWLHVDMVQ